MGIEVVKSSGLGAFAKCRRYTLRIGCYAGEFYAYCVQMRGSTVRGFKTYEDAYRMGIHRMHQIIAQKPRVWDTPQYPDRGHGEEERTIALGALQAERPR